MIKKILPLLLIALGANTLLAQADVLTSSDTPEYCSSHVTSQNILEDGTLDTLLYHHLSNRKAFQERHYFLASINHPVTAQEYCDFLNDIATDTGWWGESPYYDNALMIDSDSWFFNDTDWRSNFPIVRTRENDTYHYDVNSDQESAIIHCVNSRYVQYRSRLWRENQHAAMTAKKSEEDS